MKLLGPDDTVDLAAEPGLGPAAAPRPPSPAALALAMAARAAAAVLDVLLPPRCGACTEPVASGVGLCAACWSQVAFIGPPLCDRLGLPLPYDAGPGAQSAEALRNPPLFGRARAVAAYAGPARHLVHGLKFNDRLELAEMMAGMMARAGAELASGAEIVVPVPLHRRRLLSRRFNQSALLAAGIARRHGIPFEPLALRRIRPTVQQLGLDAAARRRNVAKAFAVAPGRMAAISGRRVLLVDDVFTTGATVEACTRALLKAGAASVDVLVFALVVRGEAAAI